MSEENLIAALDIGVNSVLLLIVKRLDDNRVEPVLEYSAMSQLGQGLAETGQLSETSISRTIDAVKEMNSIIHTENVSDVVVTVSSSIRRAENRSEFLVKCHQVLNIYPQLLNSREESRFSFIGATYQLETTKPLVLIDIGGGNVSIVFGTKENISGGFSVEIGSLGIDEKFQISESSSQKSFNNAQRYIKEQLEPYVYDIKSWIKGKRPRIMVSGGTAVTLASIIKRLPVYDRKQLNMVECSSKEVNNWMRQIAKTPLSKRRAIIGLSPERGRVIPAGLLVLYTIMKTFDFERISITVEDIKLGILKNYVDRMPVS